MPNSISVDPEKPGTTVMPTYKDHALAAEPPEATHRYEHHTLSPALEPATDVFSVSDTAEDASAPAPAFTAVPFRAPASNPGPTSFGPAVSTCTPSAPAGMQPPLSPSRRSQVDPARAQDYSASLSSEKVYGTMISLAPHYAAAPHPVACRDSDPVVASSAKRTKPHLSEPHIFDSFDWSYTSIPTTPPRTPSRSKVSFIRDPYIMQVATPLPRSPVLLGSDALQDAQPANKKDHLAAVPLSSRPTNDVPEAADSPERVASLHMPRQRKSVSPYGTPACPEPTEGTSSLPGSPTRTESGAPNYHENLAHSQSPSRSLRLSRMTRPRQSQDIKEPVLRKASSNLFPGRRRSLADRPVSQDQDSASVPSSHNPHRMSHGHMRSLSSGLGARLRRLSNRSTGKRTASDTAPPPPVPSLPPRHLPNGQN